VRDVDVIEIRRRSESRCRPNRQRVTSVARPTRGPESEPHVPQRAFCPYFVQSCLTLSRFLNLINGCSDEQSKGEEA